MECYTEQTIEDSNAVIQLLRGVNEGIKIKKQTNVTLIYRGVGNDGYELTPTAFREDGERRLAQIFKSVSNSPTMDSQVVQSMMELSAIGQFYKLANEQGLRLPVENHNLHTELISKAIGLENLNSIHRFYSDHDKWPQTEILPTMALAQHYGIPTRLLDWSYDPLIAALFAARSATRRIEESESTDGHFAIWYANKITLSSTQLFFQNKNINNPRYKIITVDTPFNGNPNLAAQQGTFTVVYRTENQGPNDAVDKTTVDQAVTEIYDDTMNVEQQAAVFGSEPIPVFQKIKIPLSEARSLQEQLWAMGYHSGKLFPGFQGCTDSLMEKCTMT